MSSKDSLSTDEDFVPLVKRLRRRLSPLHMTDGLLHSLWLETDWLLKNASQEDWVLPAAWESHILKAGDNAELARWPEVFEATCELAASLQSHLLWTPSFNVLSYLTETIRTMHHGLDSMEAAAEKVVSLISEKLLIEQTQKPVLALARCFKTHDFQHLPSALQQVVIDRLTFTPERSTKCLCLLASRGNRPDWNSRHLSVDHQAIPLTSVDMVEQSPMLARLFNQLGVQVAPLLQSETPLLLDAENQDYNVFYVPDARNSPYIPGQHFVREHGIRSVIGYGGVLPSGELFATILFFTVLLSYRTASLFKPIALATQLAMLPLDRSVFTPDSREKLG